MTEKIKKNVSTFFILKKIYGHLDQKRKKEVLLITGLSLFSSIAESISIALLIPFISFFINPDSYLFNDFLNKIFNMVNISNQKDILGVISLIFIIIVILSSFIRLSFIKKSNNLTENITSDFRIKIFNFLINQDYSYYFKHGSNEIMSNLSQKTNQFSAIIFSSINIFNSIIISSAIISVLIINEPVYTPIIIFTLVIFFFLTFKIKSRSVLKQGQRLNINQNFIIDIFENTVGYLQEIFVYNLKNYFSSIITKASEETAKSVSTIRTISMYPKIYLESFVIIFVVLCIYIFDFYERSLTSNISYLAILAFAAQKCLPLINNVYLLSINFKGATPTVLSFLEIINNDKGNLEINNNENVNFSKNIIIKDLTYKYQEKSQNILKDLNLEIKKNEKVAIKGQTGTGKTTLLNLISGLLKPTSGKILIDGNQINFNNITKWQKNIAIVPQNIFLNDATIYENIAIGKNINEIDLDKVIKVAKISQINDFVERLPNKYHEKIGERGVRLSGGQRQRISIARALYRSPEVLIMDEPTNALDSKTEKLVIENLINNKEMTIIIITHSKNTLQFFDKIIDLDKLEKDE